MKTIEERADDFIERLPLVCAPFDKEIKKEIILAMKRQDKITRHACAENILNIECGTLPCGTKLIDQDKVYSVVMNTKAV